ARRRRGPLRHGAPRLHLRPSRPRCIPAARHALALPARAAALASPRPPRRPSWDSHAGGRGNGGRAASGLGGHCPTPSTRRRQCTRRREHTKRHVHVPGRGVLPGAGARAAAGDRPPRLHLHHARASADSPPRRAARALLRLHGHQRRRWRIRPLAGDAEVE
ncbi:hypothetical protein CFC21_029789, partial [Triticum aestivum]